MTKGSVFCLLHMKKNDPRRRMTPALYMYIEKASQYFDLIRNRDLLNLELIDRSLDNVVCHSFLGGYWGALSIYLLWKSTVIQYSALTPR